MYNISVEDALDQLKTTRLGLSTNEAKRRLAENGLNALAKQKNKSLFARIIGQFKNALFLVLFFACLASIVIAILEKDGTELINAGIILVIIILNTTIGVVQEIKAQSAINGLEDLTKPYAKVMRNGKVVKVKTEELVVGDIVMLEAGDIVPADLRLIDTASLTISDAAITGESIPVEKTTLLVEGTNLPLGDQTNMAFMGSVITYGRGFGLVVAVGMSTEMGKISSVLHTTETTETPLTKRLNKTVKILTYIVLTISVVVFVIYILQGKSASKGFMVAVALAVCVVPEGLITCLTLTMAMGVKRMSANKAIIRHLSAVETLGSTQIICSDKTGTLTLNKMTIKEIFVLNKDEYDDIVDNPNFIQMINCMLLCNDSIIKIDENNNLNTLGDPTETALVHYGFSLDFNKDNINGMFPRVNELPFDSNRKLMTTLNSVGDKTIAFTKGAVDNVIEKCTNILENGVARPITAKDKELIMEQNFNYADKALRVLAYATKEVVGNIYDIDETLEQDLTFIGISGMIDPPREEVAEAIKTCKQAGITTIMITGDHKDTAFAIAREIDIANNINQVITGKELDSISDGELAEIITRCRVFARVNPEHKVRIVKAFKEQDKIVAMTGDGVNDSPSIKMADIGIGMGITGTDITKEVADVILTDDNFATIVEAVKEGRRIYSNVLKNIMYLLSTGIAELIMLFTIIIIMGDTFFGPALILWLNFITDTIPALALGIEKSQDDIMKKKPRSSRGHLFSGMTGFNMIVFGIIQSILILGVYFICLYGYDLGEVVTITMCFVSMVMIESFHAYNIKDEVRSFFKSKPFNNKLLNWGFIISVLLTFALITLPISGIKTALGITSLTWVQWLVCFGVGFIMIPIAEIVKLFIRIYYANKKPKIMN